jgi:hypothetical protein
VLDVWIGMALEAIVFLNSVVVTNQTRFAFFQFHLTQIRVQLEMALSSISAVLGEALASASLEHGLSEEAISVGLQELLVRNL